MIFNVHFLTMEEGKHLWGTLGGKQYPFVLYMLRLLEMQFKATLAEAALITQTINYAYQKRLVGG